MGGGDVLPEYEPVSSHGDPIWIKLCSYFYRKSLISTEKSVRNKLSFSGVLSESATTKMTVGTVLSFHGFTEQKKHVYIGNYQSSVHFL